MDKLLWNKMNDEWNGEITMIDELNKKNYMNNNDMLEEIVVDTSEKYNSTQSNNKKDNKYGQNQQSQIQSEEICNNILQNFNNDYKKMEDLEILSNIVKILSYCVNKCVTNTDENYRRILSLLEWILGAIQYFIIELNIKCMINKNIDVYKLSRSSYKLCQSKNNCIYQYPDDINSVKVCKNQHYPYDNLYVDCESLINYIKNYLNIIINKNNKFSNLIINNNTLDIENIKKCLITIHYVFVSMYRELMIISDMYSKNADFNIRNYHKFCYKKIVIYK